MASLRSDPRPKRWLMTAAGTFPAESRDVHLGRELLVRLVEGGLQLGERDLDGDLGPRGADLLDGAWHRDSWWVPIGWSAARLAAAARPPCYPFLPDAAKPALAGGSRRCHDRDPAPRAPSNRSSTAGDVLYTRPVTGA
jgi:hypothetical protein